MILPLSREPKHGPPPRRRRGARLISCELTEEHTRVARTQGDANKLVGIVSQGDLLCLSKHAARTTRRGFCGGGRLFRVPLSDQLWI